MTWWSSAFDLVGADRYGRFDARHVVPVGHAVFVLALGVTVGVIARRTLPAVGATVVGFLAVRLAVVAWVRPNLFAAAHRRFPLVGTRTGFGSMDGGPMTLQPDPPRLPNSWVRSVDIVDRSGHLLSTHDVAAACPQVVRDGLPAGGSGSSGGHVPAEVDQALRQCVARVGARFHVVVTYQPAGRYWSLQWAELGLYVGAAAVLVGVAFWWIRRRLT